MIYKKITWPLSHNLKWWALYIPNYMIVDYLVAPFNLYTWTDSIRFLSLWKYWAHIFILGSLAICMLLPNPHQQHHHYQHISK